MSKTLVVSDGKRERELLLVERLVVGRDPACDISHDDALLSRRHAEFVSGGDRVTVRDLGSRNGIYVNGSRVAERALQPGDVVAIGPLRVRYLIRHVPVRAALEELDADATFVTRPTRSPSPAPSSTASAAAAMPAGVAEANPSQAVAVPPGISLPGNPDIDDEATRLFQAPPRFDRATPSTPPAPPSESVRPASAHSTPEPDLNIVDAAAPAAIEAPPLPPVAIGSPPPAVSAPKGAAAPAAPTSDAALSSFVFRQLVALVGVVVIAAMIPLVFWRTGPLLMRIAIPIAAALVATYWFGNAIHRRFVDLLNTGKHDNLSPTGGDRAGASRS